MEMEMEREMVNKQQAPRDLPEAVVVLWCCGRGVVVGSRWFWYSMVAGGNGHGVTMTLGTG